MKKTIVTSLNNLTITLFIFLYSLSIEAHTYFFKMDGGSRTVFIVTEIDFNEAITIEHHMINFNSHVNIYVFSDNTLDPITEINLLIYLANNIDNIQQADEDHNYTFDPNRTSIRNILFSSGYSTILGQDSGSTLTCNFVNQAIQPGECLIFNCGEFVSPSNTGFLSKHVNLVHGLFTEELNTMIRSSLVACPLCGFEIKSRQALLRHVRDFHPDYRISIKTSHK